MIIDLQRFVRRGQCAFYRAGLADYGRGLRPASLTLGSEIHFGGAEIEYRVIPDLCRFGVLCNDQSLNWTTTKVPLWQVDCESYRRAHGPFEVRDVITPEHLEFVRHFAARYGLKSKSKGTTVIFRNSEWTELQRAAVAKRGKPRSQEK